MNYNSSLSLHRGFLPANDPLEALPNEFAPWEVLGRELPKLLLSDDCRSILSNLELLPTANLNSPEKLERAMVLLSFLGHAYVWGGQNPQQEIPESIAVPWYEVAKKLARPPVLSYASYALNNWRRIDKDKPVQLGNIVLLQNFLGGLDEEWFVLIHIDIEMKAAGALQLFIPLQQAAQTDNAEEVKTYLTVIAECLEQMCAVLDRMPESCDPHIYYHRVRPFIHGWKDNPALPNGVSYRNVAAYQNIAQQFRGETGAQSSIIPSFDALFGVTHYPDPLRVYLMEMRDYMPIEHRSFLQTLEKNGAIRDYILSRHQAYAPLRERYNDCINLLSRFRKTHLSYAGQYIQKQHQSSIANPTAVGTGGTPFMQYLRKHKDETLQFLIK